MQNGIKNLIFDWGNVIIDVTMSDFTKASNLAGIKFISEEVNSTHKAGFFQEYELGIINDEEFWNEIRKRCEKPLSNVEIDNIWNSILGGIPKDKLETLYYFSNNYSLFLLSNTNPIHLNTFSKIAFKYKDLNLLDFFSGVYLSYQLQCSKPDKKIFEKTISDVGLSTKETMFIDDSLINSEVAKALGMKVINYIPNSDLRSCLLNELDPPPIIP